MAGLNQQESLSAYRSELFERSEVYVKERTQLIDTVMADLQNRANLLKEHILAQQKDAIAKVDSFVEEFLSGDKYEHSVKGEENPDFSEMLPLQFLAQSLIDESTPLRDLFDIRQEITCQIPSMDKSAGVLYYKIAEYAGLYSIPVMELLSTSIQNKLQSNLSAFQYLLIKKNVTQDRKNFSSSKAVLTDTVSKTFDTESEVAKACYKFEGLNRIATRTNASEGWSSITLSQSSQSLYRMNVKFRASAKGYFGIQWDKSTSRIPGNTDSTGCMWHSYGKMFFQNQKKESVELGLGKLVGQVVEL